MVRSSNLTMKMTSVGLGISCSRKNATHAAACGWQIQRAILLIACVMGTAGFQSTWAQDKLAADDASSPIRIAPVELSIKDAGIGSKVPDCQVPILNGPSVSLQQLCDRQSLTVIAITSTSCPLSKKYLPTLLQLVDAFQPRGVQFLFVNSTSADNVDRMREIQQEFGDRATYVFDAEGELAAALQARTTTDTFVLDQNRVVQFHGAVDDQYGLGYTLAQPRNRYLAPALEALLAGEAPMIAATTAPGCELMLPERAPRNEIPTFYEDIATVVNERCVECHRSGGVAPFDLQSYEAVVAHAPMIRDVVERGVMPPWFAAPTPDGERSPWMNDKSLSASEKDQLFAWLDNQTPAGDPKQAPTPPTFPEDWLIGKPDAIYKFEQPVQVKATGTMPYRNVVVTTHESEDRWIEAIEIQPGDRSVVHHVLVFALPPGENEDLDRFDEGSGYWGIYVPGTSVIQHPDGLARLLPKGARLGFQMHYTPNGRATEDVTQIGLKFCKEPPQHEVKVAGIAKRRFTIPPGEKWAEVEADLQVPFDARILSFLPHAHLRGAACRYELERVDGSRQVLLDVPHYDFNWQLRYQLAEPLDVKRGDRLWYTAWYDNSPDNPANPDPTRAVSWGPQTDDEMHLGYVEYYVPGEEPDSDERTTIRLRDQLRGRLQTEGTSRIFDRVDANSDGELSLPEIQAMPAVRNQSRGQESRIEELFERLDADKSGGLSKREFAKVVEQLKR